MNQLSAEARIAAQESLTSILHAKIEQLSMDMQANFTEVKQLLKDKTDFEEFDETLKAVATKDGLTKVETRLEHIEATMATKDDIAELKNLILQLGQQKPPES